MRTTWIASVLMLACGGGNEVTHDAGTPSTILGTPVSADEVNAWSSTKTIDVVSQNGDVTILGDSTDGKVHITATPFVVAVPGDPSIAEALADVATGITVKETLGAVGTGCSFASQIHGDIARTSTGCSSVTVHVPPGDATTPLLLNAHTFNGPLTVKNVTLSDYICINPNPQWDPVGCQNVTFVSGVTNVKADVGDVIATGIVGSVLAEAEKGNVTVSVAPDAPQAYSDPFYGDTFKKSYVVVQSSGDAALSLPNDFGADKIRFTASGSITVVGFSDVTGNSLSRGAAGTGAGAIIANADHGNLTISSF